MSNTITITVPHKLGVETARKRVAEQLVKLQQEYVQKIAHSEIAWEGDVAHVKVSALGQNASADITILNEAVRIDVHLPVLLAMLSGKVKELVSHKTSEALRIGQG